MERHRWKKNRKRQRETQREISRYTQRQRHREKETQRERDRSTEKEIGRLTPRAPHTPAQSDRDRHMETWWYTKAYTQTPIHRSREGRRERDLRQTGGQRQKLTLSIEIIVLRTRIEKFGLGKTKDLISENGRGLGWVFVHINLQELWEIKLDSLNIFEKIR